MAGGIESMSRMPYLVDADDARWGHKMGNFTLVDAMYRDGFTCSVCGLDHGRDGRSARAGVRHHPRRVGRVRARESQKRAAHAIAKGRFRSRDCTGHRRRREGPPDGRRRPTSILGDTTIEALAKLPLRFPNVEGSAGIITAGTASGITDGGAAVVLMSAARASARDITPLARLIGWASAGVDPRMMGIGPVPAMRTLFHRTGLSLKDFDLFELNEAFAPQVLAVLRDEPIPADKLNVNGGAIALGHPIGCTGTRIVVTLLHEMRRRNAHRGLATLCVSGGMGMALAIENC